MVNMVVHSSTQQYTEDTEAHVCRLHRVFLPVCGDSVSVFVNLAVLGVSVWILVPVFLWLYGSDIWQVGVRQMLPSVAVAMHWRLNS